MQKEHVARPDAIQIPLKLLTRTRSDAPDAMQSAIKNRVKFLEGEDG